MLEISTEGFFDLAGKWGPKWFCIGCQEINVECDKMNGDKFFSLFF